MDGRTPPEFPVHLALGPDDLDVELVTLNV